MITMKVNAMGSSAFIAKMGNWAKAWQSEMNEEMGSEWINELNISSVGLYSFKDVEGTYEQFSEEIPEFLKELKKQCAEAGLKGTVTYTDGSETKTMTVKGDTSSFDVEITIE